VGREVIGENNEEGEKEWTEERFRKTVRKL
jgi:hypothetical protein